MKSTHSSFVTKTCLANSFLYFYLLNNLRFFSYVFRRLTTGNFLHSITNREGDTQDSCMRLRTEMWKLGC